MARTVDGILGGFKLALSLDRYQEIMHIPIAAFNGLNDPDEHVMEKCSAIWGQSTRNMLAQYLAVSEERREQELGYHLSPKYVVDEDHSYADIGRLNPKNNVILNNKKLIQVGVESVEDIQLGVSITYRDLYASINDPIELAVTTTVTNADEICVYYPGEDVTITSSSVTITGGVATIKIPRSRLVKPELLDDRKDKLQYETDDNFLATVDVKQCSTINTGGVTFVWTPGQQLRMGRIHVTDGSEVTQTGIASISGARAHRISKIVPYPASFVDDVPTGARFTQCYYPALVRVAYVSGEPRYSPNQELLTARYAHTMMPSMPCSCPLVEQYWKEDHKKADMVTPYGNTQGAQEAWFADSRAKIGIGGMWSI